MGLAHEELEALPRKTRALCTTGKKGVRDGREVNRAVILIRHDGSDGSDVYFFYFFLPYTMLHDVPHGILHIAPVSLSLDMVFMQFF